VHTSTKDKCDDTKESFYEEQESVFDQFPTYHMEILLDFNAKMGREDIFKLIFWNESLHETTVVMIMELG
jgi:hypothetical protein